MAKTQKVIVSIPGALLEQIDREAKARGTSRSDLLVEAARRELAWTGPVQIDAAIERGHLALAGIESFESADLVRADRAMRDARDRCR
jgi:metal-responsive CopG/Arc/MetJ family transcriptional regulator